MKKRYIFIHNTETAEIKVISIKRKKDWLFGTITEHHFYKMFYSKHKKFICNCPLGAFQDCFCNHRKSFLKLFLDLKEPIPIARIEIVEK